jgi:hypothetical protein
MTDAMSGSFEDFVVLVAVAAGQNRLFKYAPPSAGASIL